MSSTNFNIYIADSSAFIKNPNFVKSLKGVIVIPDVVLNELHGLKNSENPKIATNAITAFKNIEEYFTSKKGSKNPNNDSVLVIEKDYKKLPNVNVESFVDKVVLGTALLYKEKNPYKTVTLLSDKLNLRVSAASLQLNTVDISYLFIKEINPSEPIKIKTSDMPLRTKKQELAADMRRAAQILLGCSIASFFVFPLLAIFFIFLLVPFFFFLFIKPEEAEEIEFSPAAPDDWKFISEEDPCENIGRYGSDRLLY
ncbi:PIN domain-containing protein [Thermodesulfovibrio thiophilus]|uniref:PIN domain-containing protein n=1 Tax=Thermodesulfovibrio thiophilus TaxID=340095 RepID=UPI0003FD8D53|nr:PIN domain-containing protein [Thermodesulfovibrio thiophilus]